jgi:dimethylargininase
MRQLSPETLHTTAIVRPPSPNFAEGLTRAELGKPDYRRALQQHSAYCEALQQCGLTVIRLPADERYPDGCFVEDIAVMVRSRIDGPTHVVLTRPGATSREGEVQSINETIDDLFPAELIHWIEAPGTLDGGDVCEAGNHFFIGISERTNESGAQQLAAVVAQFGYTFSLVNIRQVGGLLHLKSGLAYLGDNRLVITDSLADSDEFTTYDRIPPLPKESYAANCIRVNDWMLIAAGFPKLEANLRALGYQTIAVEMSEFQKMDGGLSCLSLRF